MIKQKSGGQIYSFSSIDRAVNIAIIHFSRGPSTMNVGDVTYTSNNQWLLPDNWRIS